MKTFRLLLTYLAVLILCWIGAGASAQAADRDEIIFFFNDALGSAVSAVNETGDLCWSEVYTPYGDKTVNDDLVSVTGCGIVGEERGFAGHTEDVNSDLVYMQQRYYDPSIGRFLSTDPVGANPDSPATFNRYAYANNNPYKFVDPDGELPILVVGYYAVSAAVTAYDTYQAYQEGGPAALAQSAVIGVGLNVFPGGKVISKAAGKAADLAKVPNNGTIRSSDGLLRNSDGTFAPDGGSGRASSGTHGNTAGNQPATLYEGYDADGNFLKHGISQNSSRRYTQKELDGGYLVETQSGTRREILNIERNLVETNPGPLNREPWAGSRR